MLYFSLLHLYGTNDGERQGIFLCPYHLPFYVVKYKYVIIFSMEWL